MRSLYQTILRPSAFIFSEAQNGHSNHRNDDTSRAALTDGFGRTIVPSDSDDPARTRKTSKIRFHDRGIRQTNSEKSKAAKQRVIKMLFAVVLEFFICWTPLFLIQTWITIDIGHATTHISPLLHLSMFLLSYVSSCCNPITYCFMNRNFRNGFVSVFRCCKFGKTVRGRNDIPSYCYHYSSAKTGVSQFSDDKFKYDSDEV